ncbi:MAG: hypothetical protein RXR82_08585 [Nitrososphaeria archaeon]
MGASPSPLAGALEILPVREIRERSRPARGAGAGIPVDKVVDALVDLVRWELGSSEGPELAGLEDALERADPELAELIRLFSSLGEGEQWEVLREFAKRQAEALAERREEFLRYLDERFPDLTENTDLYVYYHALMREYEMVADRAGGLEDQYLPAEVLSALARHAAVLVARLDGRVDDEAFEWTLGELMSNVDVIPVLAPPEHAWAAEMVLKLVGALGDLAV